MTLFKQALANAKLAILLLLLTNMMLVGLCIFALHGLINMPKNLTLYVPPSIPASGLTTKVGEVPDTTVYSFAFYVWQSMQTWLNDGEKDYPNNLKNYSQYLTDDFRNELMMESKALDSNGLLMNHQQTTFNADESGFKPEDVQFVGHNTWYVHLVMRTVNRVATDDKDNGSFATSHIVRDATTSYVFKVIQTDEVAPQNHWQLQLAGFATTPKTLTIYQ